MDDGDQQPSTEALMRRAFELAALGHGSVEPNPQVGAVILDASGRHVVGEGWHTRFGGDHAEVAALAAAGPAARGGTLVVSLEPCCHQGKTPPCTEAIIASGIRRVLVGTLDPFPAVAGNGIASLRRAGIEVRVGICEAEAQRIIAPFRTRIRESRPWVIAKWAMSLDGRVATVSGESRWISSEASRRRVHDLRGRVDALLCGIGTVLADDPLLTARPAGPRRPLRIVLDSRGRLPLQSRLVRSSREAPVLVAVGPDAAAARLTALEAAGCEIWRGTATSSAERLRGLLGALAGRNMTNLMVEGGPVVLGSFADAGLIDEVWAFVAPTMIGGATAPAPVAGSGIQALANAAAIEIEHTERPGGDLLIRGVIRRTPGVTSPADRG